MDSPFYTSGKFLMNYFQVIVEHIKPHQTGIILRHTSGRAIDSRFPHSLYRKHNVQGWPRPHFQSTLTVSVLAAKCNTSDTLGYVLTGQQQSITIHRIIRRRKPLNMICSGQNRSLCHCADKLGVFLSLTLCNKANFDPLH